MSLLDFLYLSLAFGFLVLVGFVSYASYRLAKAMESLKLLADNSGDIVADVKAAKNQLKSGLASTLTTILDLVMSVLKKKGGEKHGK